MVLALAMIAGFVLYAAAVATNRAPDIDDDGTNHKPKAAPGGRVPEPDPPRRPRPWNLRAWAFKLASLPLIALVYVTMIAEGLKRLSPEFGRPLWRMIPLPLFNRMRDYEGMDRLQLAHVMALIVLFATFFACVEALKVVRDFGADRPAWSILKGKIVFTIACVLLVADATFFYQSLGNSGAWGGTTAISWGAVLMTVMYTGILVLCSYISLNLED